MAGEGVLFAALSSGDCSVGAALTFGRQPNQLHRRAGPIDEGDLRVPAAARAGPGHLRQGGAWHRHPGRFCDRLQAAARKFKLPVLATVLEVDAPDVRAELQLLQFQPVCPDLSFPSLGERLRESRVVKSQRTPASGGIHEHEFMLLRAGLDAIPEPQVVRQPVGFHLRAEHGVACSGAEGAGALIIELGTLRTDRRSMVAADQQHDH